MRRTIEDNTSKERSEKRDERDSRSELKRFAPPTLTRHQELPLITAGSLDLGLDGGGD